jgi:lipoprotein signal peptidase
VKPHQVILVGGFTAAVAAYNLCSDQEDGWFYKLMAISYVLVLWSYHRYTETPLTKLMVGIFMWVAVANVADEFLFDPYIKQWKEYTLAAILILVSVGQYLKDTNKLPKKKWLKRRLKS